MMPVSRSVINGCKCKKNPVTTPRFRMNIFLLRFHLLPAQARTAGCMVACQPVTARCTLWQGRCASKADTREKLRTEIDASAG